MQGCYISVRRSNSSGILKNSVVVAYFTLLYVPIRCDLTKPMREDMCSHFAVVFNQPQIISNSKAFVCVCSAVRHIFLALPFPYITRDSKLFSTFFLLPTYSYYVCDIISNIKSTVLIEFHMSVTHVIRWFNRKYHEIQANTFLIKCYREVYS